MAMYKMSWMIQNFGRAQIVHNDSVICYVFSFKWEIAGANTGWRAGEDSNMERPLGLLDIKQWTARRS
jgi:hypothetical protein